MAYKISDLLLGLIGLIYIVNHIIILVVHLINNFHCYLWGKNEIMLKVTDV
jgi:hypothetical protein